MKTVMAPWVKDSNFYLLDHECQGQKRAQQGRILNSHHWLTIQKMTEYLPGQVVERGHPKTGHHCPFPLLRQQLVPDCLLGPQRLLHLRRNHMGR